MPPKAKGGKKGGKLSKAEKEKLKAEEAERKAFEEEQARIAAEKAELERIEREKLEKEERRKFEEQERIRHQAEIDELSNIIEDNERIMKNALRNEIEDNKWHDYISCTGRPDPTSQKGINTFISLWKDQAIPTLPKHLLQQCEDALNLVKAIQQFLSIAEHDEQMPSVETCTKIHHCLLLKLDSLSKTTMQNPSTYLESDTMNLHFQESSNNLSVSIWGNVAKNPRAKSIDFLSPGFSMELPKALVLADVALRVYHTQFDLFSSKCSTYNVKVETKTVEENTSEECLKSPEMNENNSDEELKQMNSFATNQDSQTAIEKDESKDDIETEEAEANSETMLQAELTEDDLLDENIVDLRAFSLAGPVIDIELFQLPPQPKTCNGWVMQQALTTDLKPYGLTIISKTIEDKGVTPSASDNDPAEDTRTKSQVELDLKYISDPIKIKISLASVYAFFEEPTLARWDEETCHWLIDGFEEVKYEGDERTIEFQLCHFGPIGVFQDLYINMPFQSWEIQPKGNNHCVFTLFAAIVELEIEIKEGKCRLIRIGECTSVDNFLNKWMPVDILIENCKQHGLNVFPAVDGKKYVAVTDKDFQLVNHIYHCIALLASSFSFRWSKWNAESAFDAIVVQACDAASNQIPKENDYKLFMTTSRICCELAMMEGSESFSSDVQQGRQMHPNLYHMLFDGSSTASQSRIQQNKSHFINSIGIILQSINPIIYS